MNSFKKVFGYLFSFTGPFVITLASFQALKDVITPIWDLEKGEGWKLFIPLFLFFSIAGWIGGTAINNGNSGQMSSAKLDDIVVTSSIPGYRIILRHILSLGLTLFLDWMFSRKKIFYSKFKKPDDWTSYPTDHKPFPILRIYMHENSYEFRFPKNGPNRVLVRNTLPGSNIYGEFRLEKLTKWWVLFLISPLAFLNQYLSG